MLIVTTQTVPVQGELRFRPVIQFNGQVWAHPLTFGDEDVAYSHGVQTATKINAIAREHLKGDGFEPKV